jgi:hypothetical protein
MLKKCYKHAKLKFINTKRKKINTNYIKKFGEAIARPYLCTVVFS